MQNNDKKNYDIINVKKLKKIVQIKKNKREKKRIKNKKKINYNVIIIIQ